MRTAVAALLVSAVLASPASAQVPQGPPDAFLGSGAGEVRGEVQVFCWFEQPPLGVCVDRFDPVDPAIALTVEAGALLTLRFDRPFGPTDITVSRYDAPPGPNSVPVSSFAVPAGNPTQFRADLPLGTSFLRVGTNWGPRGGGGYVFEVTVVAPGPSCTGLSPTITGTSARDTLVGTPGPDVIVAGAGNDVVLGLGGADLLCGGDGHDIFLGGDGADRILGEAGDDTALGQNGDDTVVGGPGRDRLLGGPGADALDGGANFDLCSGDLGMDTAATCEWAFGVP